MKKLLSKRVLFYLLSLIAVVSAVPSDIGGGCSLLFYEPKKPDMLKSVTKEDLFD